MASRFILTVRSIDLKRRAHQYQDGSNGVAGLEPQFLRYRGQVKSDEYSNGGHPETDNGSPLAHPRTPVV